MYCFFYQLVFRHAIRIQFYFLVVYITFTKFSLSYRRVLLLSAFILFNIFWFMMAFSFLLKHIHFNDFFYSILLTVWINTLLVTLLSSIIWWGVNFGLDTDNLTRKYVNLFYLILKVKHFFDIQNFLNISILLPNELETLPWYPKLFSGFTLAHSFLHFDNFHSFL